MKIAKDGIALIVAGDNRNIGKLVYVMGTWLPDRLPQIGRQGEPRWHVQMLSSDLIGDDDEEYVAGSVCEKNLMPIEVTTEVAKSLREDAMMRFMCRVLAELKAEESRPVTETNDYSFFFVTEAAEYRATDPRAKVCEIPKWCAQQLNEQGLAEPIASHILAGKFWWVNVDIAYKDFQYESGCGMVDDIFSTEDIAQVRNGYFIKVMAGPFDTKDKAQYALDAKCNGQR